jgi:hypothetical protein
MQINAIEQRAGQLALVFGGTALICSTLAEKADVARTSAPTGVHRSHQHEARRISDAVIGARDGDFAGFEGLAQRVKHLAGKLRQLVKEQNAVVRK